MEGGACDVWRGCMDVWRGCVMSGGRDVGSTEFGGVCGKYREHGNACHLPPSSSLPHPPSSLHPSPSHTENFVSSVQCGRESKRRSWQNCMKDLKRKKV